MSSHAWPGIVIVLAAVGGVCAADEFFAKKVEPLLKAHCYECHSHGAGAMEGGLTLDSRSGWAQGGSSGPAVMPHQPDGSLLIRMVRWTDDDHQMPPGGKLDEASIATLTEWVARGAPDPRTLAPSPEAAPWWSLEPLPSAEDHRRRTEDLLEAAGTAGVARGDAVSRKSAVIDALIAAKLAEKGLTRGPEADRADLIRRLTLSLHGLPPSPEEIAAFVTDPDPRAYAHLVERLLASPRYGERFARLWLDVVHYGESNGYGMDRPRMHAWPYRDWVIAAFNDDKPYPRFVQEQLAADALFPAEPRLVPALGFIAAGPFNQSALAEQTDGTDCKKIALNLDRDDMVSNVATTFLSMTVHCARCHQHKFDPISQHDYYAMQSVFAGVVRGDLEFDADPGIMRERKHWQQVRTTLSGGQPLTALTDKDRKRLAAHTGDLVTALVGQEQAWRTLGVDLVSTTAGITQSRRVDGSVLLAGDLPETDVITGTTVLDAGPIAAIRLELLADDGLPQRGPGRVPNTGSVVLTEIKLTAAPADAPDQKTPVKIRRGRADYEQPGKPVSAAFDGKDDTGWAVSPREGQSHQAVFEFDKPVVHPCGTILTIALEQKFGTHHLLGCVRLSAAQSDVSGHRLVSPDIIAAVARPGATGDPEVHASLAVLLADDVLAELPQPLKVWAVGSRVPRVRNYAPPPRPYPIHVLIRGDIKRLGQEVQPGGLECVRTLPARFDVSEPAGDPVDESGRRAALARWITSPDNMLAWRSIANRIWSWHFGRGIVESHNDFGRMGSPPSHPELLDWLACEFRDSGGSFRHLHRLILATATWRQAANVVNPAAVAIDADARLLWRQQRRRLDAEQIRDSLLAASGLLDDTVGGPSAMQFVFSDPNVNVMPRIDYAGFDPDAATSRRRGVYRFLLRGVNDPLLDAFDAPDPSLSVPRRDETVTPLQSLSILNNRFVLRHCEHLAARVEKEIPDLAGRIDRAAELLWGRVPEEPIRQRLVEHAVRHGLAHACRVLVAANAFLYVE
jgi:hypothetical protein